MIITRFSDLIREYHRLGVGDVFVGRVPSSILKSALLGDLTDRGVTLMPSITAQILNGSKVAQAFVLNPWMVPHTLAITRRKELLDAVTIYTQKGIHTVVTKADGLHCGHGVRKWDNLETLYSCLAFDEKAFPFVLQPFVSEFTDVRVVLVNDFCEAYSRCNQNNFRMNLAGGGRSAPYDLTHDQIDLCRMILKRANMPFAHLDLMLVNDGAIYLAEIRMNGGLHGAKVDRLSLDRMKKEHLQGLAESAHRRMNKFTPNDI